MRPVESGRGGEVPIMPQEADFFCVFDSARRQGVGGESTVAIGVVEEQCFELFGLPVDIQVFDHGDVEQVYVQVFEPCRQMTNGGAKSGVEFCGEESTGGHDAIDSQEASIVDAFAQVLSDVVGDALHVVAFGGWWVPVCGGRCVVELGAVLFLEDNHLTRAKGDGLVSKNHRVDTARDAG